MNKSATINRTSLLRGSFQRAFCIPSALQAVADLYYRSLGKPETIAAKAIGFFRENARVKWLNMMWFQQIRTKIYVSQ
jgi:hypothetical protein